MRKMDWALALLVTVVAGAVLLLPPDSRPEDLVLTVTAQEMAPTERGRPPRVALTVKWRWLKQPAAWWGRSRDYIAFADDNAIWHFCDRGSHSEEADRLLARHSLPYAFMHIDVTPGQDGEKTCTGIATGQHHLTYRPTALPVQVHYIHVRPGPPWRPTESWAITTGGPIPIQ